MRIYFGWILAIATAFNAIVAPCASLDLKAPPAVYPFQSFGAEDGLSNVATTAMAMDAEGLFWVGTEDGLFRLEGNKFRRFGMEDGLPSARIDRSGLTRGVSKGLWVVTEKGLAYWNGAHFLRPSMMGIQGMDERPAMALNQGGAILSDFPGKMRYFSKDGEPFKALEGLPWGKGLTAGTYSREKDLLLMALGRELWAFQKGQWTHWDYTKVLPDDVVCLWIDIKGTIWFRCPERLGRLASLGKEPEWISTPVPLTMVASGNLGIDAQGRLWTNAAEGMIWIKDGDSGCIGEREGIPPGGADCLHVDHQGTVWIGSEGVHKLLGDGFWTSYSRRQGLPASVVWSISRTRDGLLWAGTYAGLAVSGENGWQKIPRALSNQFGYQAEDEDGYLWLGHTPSKKYPYPLSFRRPKSLELQPVELPGAEPGCSIAAILPEGKTLWLGSSSMGLLRARREGTRLHTESISIGNWPKDEYISRVEGDGRGGIWVASTGGLAHWNGVTWATLDKSSGLPDNDVLALTAMPDGTAWGSFRSVDALAHVSRDGGQLKLLEVLLRPHPLLNHSIVTLHGDRNGILWIATSLGLLRWDGTHVTRFGRNVGFPGDDCAQNALWFDPNGDVWVGVSVGLVRGRLSMISGEQRPPPAVLFVATRGDKQSILSTQGPIKVPYSTRTMTFTYGPRGSRNTEDVAYQVRLVGLEDTWRDTTMLEARYPNLGSGKYRFEVRIQNSMGEIGETCALAFTILNPWWKTWWFRSLAVLAAAGSVLLIIRWRTFMLLRRTVELETQVQERTWDLEVANKALEEASMLDPLTSLRNRRYLGLSLPGEIANTVRVFYSFLKDPMKTNNLQEDLVFFIMDLDHFKQVNDTYGHAAGDQVLRETAAILKSVCRESDTLVRWGGEEFLLIAKRTNRIFADRIAMNLCEAISSHEYKLPDGTRLHKTMSIGYAAFPILESAPCLLNWEESLEIADQCMYAAKHSGRNGFVGVTSGQGGEDTEAFRHSLIHDLPVLAAKGSLKIKTSFAGPDAIRWKN